MGAKKKVKSLENGTLGEERENISSGKVSKKEAREHKEQLERLKKTQPEFYKYLEEVDEELLNFDDEGIDDDAETDGDDVPNEKEDEVIDDGEDEDVDEDEVIDDIDDEDVEQKQEKEEGKQTRAAITMEMVDTWCNGIQENGKIAPVRSLLRAFRTACHYGDDGGGEGDSSAKLSIMSSDVFNKIMLFTLSNMDGILRNLMKLPTYGGKKEKMMDLKNTKLWTKYNHLVKSYLGNSLHVLNQMTDSQMISFTLRRLKYSSLFLAAFPTLLRKYIKVALHFWGTGGGDLPTVAFLFMRDLCIRLGSDSLDDCLKGLYKAYVMNCQFVNASKLQHIHFLRNCLVEFLRVDLPAAYQHAFVFIRQLAMILRDSLDMKTKEAFRKVYEWKFINCLELWTGAICEYGSEADFRPLAYPLTQIISGVARLVPTARYFPLRLRCVKMLNRIAAATNTFIPVSMLLLDMLEMKELHMPPTGGVGKSIDFRTIIKVSKPALKTRAFQEACVFSAIEELGEHLAQWSYSVAFFELSFIPAVRLRSFCKTTKVERFRKEMKELIRQIEANSEFTNGKRATISFLPSDPAAISFLEDEKTAGASPLSIYAITLRQKAQQRNDSLIESSVIVGAESSVFGKKLPESDEEDHDDDVGDNGAAAFSSSWLPGKELRNKRPEEEKNKMKKQPREALEEDIIEELVLSSDEEDEPIYDSAIAAPEVAVKKHKGYPKRNNYQPTKNASSKSARGGGFKRKRGH